MSRTAYASCTVCRAYLARRTVVLAPAFALQSLLRSVHPDVVAHEFMFAVHARHLAGGCLSTRRRTPDVVNEDGSKRLHVRRSCNGCGNDMGDANDAELDAAVAGHLLPDVRLECGCLPSQDAA
jgi:hypothetical protein